MHPYVLVPLLAAVAAAALASAVAARDPRSPANRLMALLMLSAGLWSLGVVLWNTADGPVAALRLMRASCLPALLLAPLTLHLLLVLGPALAEAYRRWLVPSYALTAGIAVLWTTTPWMVAEALATSWGWSPAFGPGAPLASAAAMAIPLAAMVSSLRLHRECDEPERRLRTWLHVSVVVPLSITSITDLALPLRGIPAPPFGSATVVCWGAAVWWLAYRFREPRLSPRRFAREILETLPDGVALLRMDGSIRTTNARMAELCGHEPDALLGRPIDTLLFPHSGTGEHVGEGELRTPSGGCVPVSVSRAPLRDAGGSPIGQVLAVYDLSEVASLRSRLVTSGRLAAVGQLAAGIAHEINNPIAYVRSNLALLERHCDEVADRARKASDEEDFEAPRIVAECRDGVERVASIARDVGGFASRGAATLENADLNELLEAAVRVATPQLRSRATIERRYGALPRVRCVPQELMQVFLNLLLNAAQSFDARGTIHLVTETKGPHVEVRIEDDGRGLPEGADERIFDAFFTTKPAGEGTGLGLALSRQIVVRHDGEIGAMPRAGGGTVVWLRIPSEGPAGVAS